MHTAAEGLATRIGFELPQQILREHLDDFVLVSENELGNATLHDAGVHPQPDRASRRRAARRSARARPGGQEGRPDRERRQPDARPAARPARGSGIDSRACRPKAPSPTAAARPGTASSATARSPASCRSSACTAGPARCTTTSSRSRQLAAHRPPRRLLRPDRLRPLVGREARRLLDGRALRPRGPGRPRRARARPPSTCSARPGAAMLAMEYALTQPTGLASLVLSSVPASIPLWAERDGRLRRSSPRRSSEVLDEHEAAGTSTRRSTRRLRGSSTGAMSAGSNRTPTSSSARFAGLAEHPDVYMHMQGPNEFVITGTLKDWDITARLGEIDVPTLITAGAHDEFTPRQAQVVNEGIQGSELVTFENSFAHAVRRGARALPRGRRRLPRPRRAGIGFAARGARLPDAARPDRRHAGRPPPEDRRRARLDAARSSSST